MSGSTSTSSASTTARCPAGPSSSASRDGAELGTGVHDYPHAVIERPRCPATGERRCRRTGRCRCPTTTARCCATAVPEAVAAAGIDPADVIGIATDFTACTMVPTLADGTPLCELDGFADRPHAYVKLWKHHAAQAQADRINALAARARRGLAAALRRADLLGVGVRQGAAAASRRTARSTTGWSTGSRPPTGSSGSCAARYVRNACTAGYKGILPGRRLPVGRTSSPR